MSQELREAASGPHTARHGTPPGPRRGAPSPGLRTVAVAMVAAVSGAAAGAVVSRHHTTSTASASTPGNLVHLATTDAASVAASVAAAVVAIARRPPSVDQLFATTPSAGRGTGVVIRFDGMILTDSALVTGPAPIIVRLSDGRTLPATVVGRDVALGIAVLKVAARDLPTATLAGSDELRVGDGVVALGDALALPGGPTVATGVVAARRRTVAMATAAVDAGPARLGNLLQITNALGAGYAGGPVVDSSGTVVGIATTAADGDRAPGFAIDIARVRSAIARIEAGRAPVDALGVDAIDVTPALARDYTLPVESGALVAAVVPHSPAADAGLLADDIVVGVGRRRVATAEDLARDARDPSSTSFRVFVRRGTKTLTLSVHVVH